MPVAVFDPRGAAGVDRRCQTTWSYELTESAAIFPCLRFWGSGRSFPQAGHRRDNRRPIEGYLDMNVTS